MIRGKMMVAMPRKIYFIHFPMTASFAYSKEFPSIEP
jgi:hypothetical protein